MLLSVLGDTGAAQGIANLQVKFNIETTSAGTSFGQETL